MFSVKMGNQSTNIGSLENNFDPGARGDPMGMNCRKDMPDRYPAGDGNPYGGQGDLTGADTS